LQAVPLFPIDKPPEFQEEVFAHLFEITDKTRFEEAVHEEFERSETGTTKCRTR
jgi:hypothetical protein